MNDLHLEFRLRNGSDKTCFCENKTVKTFQKGCADKTKQQTKKTKKKKTRTKKTSKILKKRLNRILHDLKDISGFNGFLLN